MDFILISIITFIILLPVLIYLILKTQTNEKSNNIVSNYCTSDDQCSPGTKCVYSNDYNHNICSSRKYCSTDNNNLTKCSLSDPKSCKKICNNDLQFKCTEVSSDKPYFYQKDNLTVKIKNSDSENNFGWCLPDLKQAESIKCNEHVAEDILIKNPDDSYKWGCYCKTNLFTHENTPTSDCLFQLACQDESGKILDLYVPNYDNSKNKIQCTNSNKNTNCPSKDYSKCLSEDGKSLKDTESGFCYSKWKDNTTDKSQNPFEGFCDCPSGTFTTKIRDGYNSRLICSKDSCYPGTKNGNSCSCPNEEGLDKNYIRCPDDVNDTIAINAKCDINNPKCIVDTCKNGKWDPDKKICKCDPGYINKSPYSNLLNSQCVAICGSENNPCFDRGECYIDDKEKDVKNQAKCNCRYPYKNKDSSDFVCTKRFIPNGDNCIKGSECYSGNCSPLFNGALVCK